MFEKQMACVRCNFSLLSLDAMIGPRSGDVAKPLAVTFDDGYGDNFIAAYPVLKKRGIPATFFLTVSQIGKNWDFPEGPYSGLSWEQVDIMQKDPMITIGSHGYGHKRLDLLTPVAAAGDIKISKMILEEKIGRPVEFFSYPYGSFNEQIKKAVREAGFRAAFGVVSPRRDRFSWPRILISRGDNMFRFRLKLSPLYWPLRHLF